MSVPLSVVPVTIPFLRATPVTAADSARRPREGRGGAVISKRRRRALALNLSSFAHQRMDLRDKVFVCSSSPSSEAWVLEEEAFH